jgi:hypothetical protein
MGLKLCWIYIQSGWYYRWMFETRLIQYLKQPFFKSCGFLLAPWIIFSNLFIGFMHAHLHYISQKCLGMGISLSFHSSLEHNRGILWKELFALVYICALRFITTSHPICVFLLLVDDMHIVGLASNVLLVFCDYKRNLEH